MDISKIDKNFLVEQDLNTQGMTFYDVEQEPFKVYGVFKENGKYRRLPEAVAKTVSDGVYSLHANTAGGRVRFLTDSSRIAIFAKLEDVGKMSHFALTGSAGFDLYVADEYVKTFAPPFNVETAYSGEHNFGFEKPREITINFPLYSDVAELVVGVEEGAFIKAPKPYKNSKPVVYYGSSITQGGCASRPGMSYQSIVSRRFDCDYINLGFSGNAKAEDEMIDYLKSLEMSLFVLDYDHNAPSVEHLRSTHGKLFGAVRENNPDLPIVMMSRPVYSLNDEEKQRLEIIENTYNTALEAGDEKVFLLNGTDLTRLCGNEGTVDGCHPTDFGFASMAQALGDLMEGIDFIG